MKRVKLGFTLVEVSLFLVITSVIFVGIAVGTQNSIFQQRYNDTVQNYAEFLRRVYSQVNNVQSDGDGQSDKAIYGKLITYGQEYDLDGEKITDGEQHVFVYDVIGDVGDSSLSGNVLKQLATLNANVVIKEPDGDGYYYRPVGYPEDYVPRWGAEIQTSAAWGDGGYTEFKGAILIVRHPSSGKVYTFVSNDAIEVNRTAFSVLAVDNESEINNLLKQYLENSSFILEEVNFCINPNGAERSGLRRDVRLVMGARNSSGVQIVPDGGCD